MLGQKRSSSRETEERGVTNDANKNRNQIDYLQEEIDKRDALTQELRNEVLMLYRRLYRHDGSSEF